MLGRVWCCVSAKASTFSNMWCRAWFGSSVQSCAGRRMHQPCTQSHIVAAVGGHHESSHRVGILSVSSCDRCGVFVIAVNGHVDVRDVLFFRSQDVCLKIDLWHPVLFRKHPEQCFIQNHVVAPTETVPASVEQKMEMSPCGICTFMERRPSEHVFHGIFIHEVITCKFLECFFFF